MLSPWKGGVLTTWPRGHKLAPQVGLEPTTSWLTVMRSTDWAIEEYSVGSFNICLFFYIYSLKTINAAAIYGGANRSLFRQRPTFPGGHPPSIISAKELNFRVRNGNGWSSSLLSPDLSLSTQQCKKSLRYLLLTLLYLSSSVFCPCFGQVLDLLVSISWTRHRAYTFDLSTT